MSNLSQKSLVREDQQTVTVGTQSWDVIWSASAPARLPTEPELAADGWKSVVAIAEVWGISRAHCEDKLRQRVEEGTFERVEARLGPTFRRGYVYRPVAPKVTRLVR